MHCGNSRLVDDEVLEYTRLVLLYSCRVASTPVGTIAYRRLLSLKLCVLPGRHLVKRGTHTNTPSVPKFPSTFLCPARFRPACPRLRSPVHTPQRHGSGSSTPTSLTGPSLLRRQCSPWRVSAAPPPTRKFSRQRLRGRRGQQVALPSRAPITSDARSPLSFRPRAPRELPNH